MIQSVHATPQIFINGMIKKAENFNYNEMFIKVIEYNKAINHSSKS